jgi:hypothetical protein
LTKRPSRQLLHQRRAHAHGHAADHLAARGLGVQDAPRRADGQHAPDARLSRRDVDADFHEVRAEGGLLHLLVEVAELDGVFSH